MQPRIVINSGAPRIAGTRISVYDVLALLSEGASVATIAEQFQLRVDQIESAVTYLGEHRADVEATYAQILARNARGNMPEILDKLMASTGKAAAMRDRLRREKAATIPTEASPHEGILDRSQRIH